MDADAARALLAGFVSGVAAAFAATALALVVVARSPWWQARAGEARGLPLPLLGIVFANGMVLAWSLLGLVLGAAYLGVDDARRFAALVLAGIALALGGAAFVRGRLTAPMGVTAALAALAFGVMLPLLAS